MLIYDWGQPCDAPLRCRVPISVQMLRGLRGRVNCEAARVKEAVG